MNPHPYPLTADASQLEACLELLKDRPLKLVAASLRGDERPWNSPQWEYQVQDGRVIGKDLLELPSDHFQFSLAAGHTRQERHTHLNVFEIYISAGKIGVNYTRPDGERGDLEVESGALLVPPGIEHEVKVHALTFVVQCATPGQRVSEDKVVSPAATR